MPKRPETKISLLEYIVRRLLGPPEQFICGVPHWPCPVHGGEGPKFYLTENATGKVRYHCWSAGCWGDERDLVKALYPSWKWHDKLEQFTADYERNPNLISTEGCSMVKKPRTEKQIAAANMNMAWADFDEAMKSPVASVHARGRRHMTDFVARYRQLQSIAERNHVTTDDLVNDLDRGERWFKKMDEEHLAECDDPECATWCVAERERRDAHLAASFYSWPEKKQDDFLRGVADRALREVASAAE